MAGQFRRFEHKGENMKIKLPQIIEEYVTASNRHDAKIHFVVLFWRTRSFTMKARRCMGKKQSKAGLQKQLRNTNSIFKPARCQRRRYGNNRCRGSVGNFRWKPGHAGLSLHHQGRQNFILNHQLIQIMPTYVIFIRKHTKVPAELETYSQKAPASLAGRPVKVNALYGRHEVIEGEQVEGAAILEFPSF